MTEEKLVEIIEVLETEREEQKQAYWLRSDRKYEALERYDDALRALKEIAYYQFDREIE